METLDEGPFKAAWRELDRRILELCAYYAPRAAQQWLRTQMGPGGKRMQEMSAWIDSTMRRAVENDDPFTPRILTSWEGLKLRRNELEHAIASDAGLVYHNSRQVRGSYHWTTERLVALTDGTRALTGRVKALLAYTNLARMELELGGAVLTGSHDTHIGGHHPSECEYCEVQFDELSGRLIDEMIEKRVEPSEEGWRLITDNMGFAMTAAETELEVRERLQRRLEHAEQVARLLESWETGAGEA